MKFVLSTPITDLCVTRRVRNRKPGQVGRSNDRAFVTEGKPRWEILRDESNLSKVPPKLLAIGFIHRKPIH